MDYEFPYVVFASRFIDYFTIDVSNKKGQLDKQALKTQLSFILIKVKEVAKGQPSLNVFQPGSCIL